MRFVYLSSELTRLIAEKGSDGLINEYEKPLLGLMVFVIMFGMGATLNLHDFRIALKRPRGIIIGFLSQFGFMPAVAFGLSYVFNLDPQNAIALIMIGCLPAGTTSNMFSYFSRGDLALSISMTTASTLMAILMTPVLLVFYTTLDPASVGLAGSQGSIATQMTAEIAAMQGANADSSTVTAFEIPTKDIISSLIVVLVPVIMGMILLKYSPGWAKAAEDTAGFMGIIVILFLLASVAIRHTELLTATPGVIYAASILVGLAGFKFGFIFAWLLRLPPRFQRTISLETGIQNGPLAFAIVILSFQEPLESQILWLPILYSAFIVLTSAVVTLIYRRVGKQDYELYENEKVQKELFGPNYRHGMSGPVAAQ